MNAALMLMLLFDGDPGATSCIFAAATYHHPGWTVATSFAPGFAVATYYA